MTSTSDLAARFTDEAAQLDLEIAEIELLVNQARTEAGRHETRRATAADRLAKLGDGATAKDVHDLATQVTTITRRAALMEAQLEILEGKRRSIERLRDVISAHAAAVVALETGPPAGSAGNEEPVIPPALARIILAAQEDLRRDIARAMHDGPAQSLTNIVLQAAIVERLMTRDPALAATEVRQLVAMVEQTLEATKTFIFDVRPMVLDDLGLVPTLRRSARDRGRRTGVAVEFESTGVDRRLSMELESGIFRMADEALAAYLAARAEHVTLGLDWGEVLTVSIRASRAARVVKPLDEPTATGDVPPALAAMMDERRAGYHAEVEAARRTAFVALPARLVRDLLGRAATLSITADVSDDGGVRLQVELGAAPA